MNGKRSTKKKKKTVRCHLIPVRSAVIKEIDGYKEIDGIGEGV